MEYYEVILDITNTPVEKDGKFDRITIPAGTICNKTSTTNSKMSGETYIVSCTINGLTYNNICFPISWLKEDTGEGPFIKEVSNGVHK